MAKGRQGFALEAWKFSVYLIIPIVASVYFSEPKRQKEAADYWQYVRYPANPNVGMKQKIEELAKEQKQREVYREQLQALSQQASKTEQQQPTTTTTTTTTTLEKEDSNSNSSTGNRLLRWIGLGKSRST